MAADLHPPAGSAVAEEIGVAPRPGPPTVGPPRWLGTICPYLRAADGTWRSAVPTREHRCWAVEPASGLPTATQQELCLSDAHGGCERYLRSREQRAAELARDEIEVVRLQSARFGPFVSSIPVAVDSRPAGSEHGGSGATRRRVPTLLVGGGVVLVGVVALAVILGGGRLPGVGVVPVGSPGVTEAPAPRESVVPLPTSGVVPTSAVVATPAATAVPTPPATSPATSAPPGTPGPDPTATVQPTPSPEIVRRYTVKSGDTIKSIANKFGIKPRELRAVNDIGDEVEVGQRLRIPARTAS